MNGASDISCRPFLAYVRRNDDGSCAIHDLDEHVRAVGDLGKVIRGGVGSYAAA
jgi:hypothetical protein